MERSGVLPITLFACRKYLSTCDAFLCMPHTLQSVLDSGEEAWIIQIDFCADFDWVNRQSNLYKLCSVRIGGSAWSILTVSIKHITARYGGWLSD